MTKRYLTILSTAVIVLAALAFISFKMKKNPQSQSGNKIISVSINGRNLSAEIADTAEKTTLGLSGRESMCEKCGMLFIFDADDYRGFWMKDMKFNLDIIWISGTKVVYLAKNLSHEKGMAESVTPGVKADKVLELNAGMSDNLGIKVGDTVGFME